MMIEKFHDLFSGEGKTLRPMSCIPAEINVIPEETPKRIFTARKLANPFRDETKKELDTMVRQGVLKPMGNIAATWCHPMALWKNLMEEFGFVLT